MEAIILNSEMSYYNENNQLVRIIKKGKRTVYKSIGKEVIFDLSAPTITKLIDDQYVEKKINKSSFEKAERIMEIAKELSKNKKVKTAVKTMIGLYMILSITTLTVAAAPATAPTLAGSAEIIEVQNFIKLIINTIRILSVSICGLISANTGLKILTEENTDGPKEAKKSFQKILWALFLTFAGTGIASLLAKKLLGGL